MKGLLLFTVVLLATVAIEGHGNGWCRGPRSHLNRRFDVGYALRFDGNDYVELPAISLGGTLSFEFLVNVQSGVTGPILSFGPANNNIEISLNNNKRLSLSATRPGSGNSVSTTTATSNQVQRDGWQYFVVTIENNRQVSFYTGADEDDDPTGLGGNRLDFLPAFASRTPGYIGRTAKSTNNSPNNYFTGDLDDIRVWSRVLSQSEMDRNRDIQDGDSSLIAWWNFNQGVQNIATDVSFQGRDGTLGGNNFSATPEWIISQFTRTRSCKIYRDVSMKTFDRKCFRIPTNRVGDFWLVEGNNLDVLAIQVRIQSKPGSNQGTVVKELAFQYSDVVFRWDLDFASKSDSYFFVNNTRINLNNYEDPYTGVSVYKTFNGNNKHQYDVDVALGFKMKIEAFPRDYWTDITVRVPITNADSVSGLCGDFNGQQSGDDTPPVSDTWPVSIGQSLFQGPVNLTFPEPYVCAFVPGSQLEADANTICGNRSLIASYLEDECLSDICVAGDIGAAYALAEATYQDCVDDGSTFCRPPCPNFCSLRGTCQLSGVCVCQSGYSGADCSQQPRYPCFQAQWGDKQRQINVFKGVSSAIDHYAYSRTHPFSSASGKELSDTTNLYLYQEMSTNFLSLIHLNDKARDNTGGRVKAVYSYTSTPSSNPSIKVYDDPSYVDDTYTNVNNGNFTANWQWWGCCTDGLVLELIRSSSTNNFCVAVNLTRYEGISQVVVSSENDYGSSDIVKLDNDRVRLCGTTCNNTCGTYSNCQSCTNDPKCGWCVETETCELGTSGGPDRGRCNLWRYSNRNNVARVVKTQVSYPVDPSASTIYLPTGLTATADFFVFVPSPENLPLDIVFSLDVTKYFGNDLAYIQSSTAAVFTSMSTYFPQSRLGITSFSDAPFQPLGSPSQGDFAYQENLRLTSNIAAIQNSLNSIIPRDGGDAQNSQLTALLQAARSTSLNWRSSAMKLIVVITKSDFHRPPTAGLPSGATEYPTPTAVRDALLAANIVPIFVVPTNLQSNYQSLVTSWGFGYVRGISSISAANIFSGVQETVNLLSTSIKAISLPATAPNVNNIYPAQGYTGISPGTRVVFTATLSQTISGGATIIVPGFGSVDFTFISSDLPQGASQTVTALNGGSSTIIQLYAYGYYGQAYPEITSIPNQTRARIYQVTNGGNKGQQITSVPATLQDLTNKVWIDFVSSGTSSFTYQVKDSCLACSTTNYTVSINYQTTNQAPTATNPGLVSLQEDGNSTIIVTGTDPEDGNNVVTVITSFPTAGALFLPSGAAITSGNPVITGNQVVFKPVANQYGPPPSNIYSSFTFAVRDTQGLQSSPVLVSIVVTPVNDAPVAVTNSTSTNEDTPLFISLSASDIEGDALVYRIVSLPQQTAGYLARQSNGAALAAGATLNGSSVWFIPVTNFNAQASFQFRVNDGNLDSAPATITINVIPVNDAPTATAKPYTGTEDLNLTIALEGTDPDVNTVLSAYICIWNGVGTLRQFTGELIPSGSTNTLVTDANRRVVYTPPLNAYSNLGQLTSFTFKVSDGSLQSACAVASIFINGVADAPIAIGPSQVYTNESRAVSFTVSGQNLDLGSVDFRVCRGPTFGSLTSSNGALTTGSVFSGLLTPPDLTFASLTFTPPQGASGSPYDYFSFQAFTSSLNSSCVTVNFFVNAVNDPPVVTNSSTTTLEDTPVPITLTATDPDSASITFIITRLPSRGVLRQATDLSIINTVNSNVGNGTVVFEPALNENGINYDSFDFVATDGQAFSSPATFIITVFASNDRPVAYPFSLSFTDVTSQDITQFNGFDVEDGANLDVTIESTATNGTLYICQSVNDANCDTVIATAGANAPLKKVRFVPNPSVYGTYIVTFTYSVVDSLVYASLPVTVTLTVTKSNNPPSIVPVETPVSTFLGQYSILRVIASDPDVGQTVSVLVYPTGIIGSLKQCNPDGNGGCVVGDDITIDPTLLVDSDGRVLYFAPGSSGSRTGDTTVIRFAARDSLNVLSPPTIILVNVLNPVVPLTPLTTSISFNEKVTSYPFALAVNSTGNIVFTVTVLPRKGYLTQSDGTNVSVVPTNVTNGGNLVYVKPNSFDNGANYDNFTWTAVNLDNGATLDSPAVTTVSVSLVNDAPLAIIYNPPVFDEDVAGFIQLTAYDPDVDTNGDTLSFTILIAPNLGGRFYQVDSNNVTDLSGAIVNGQTVTSPYGLVWFVPPANFYTNPLQADITFRYRVTDGSGLTSQLDVLITVNPINDPPIAYDSRFTGVNNQPVTSLTFNNFTDVEVSANIQTAYIQIVTLPPSNQGILYFDAVISGNEAQPGVNYTTRIFKFQTAQAGAYGNDYTSFTWRVSDGITYSSTVTASIDIVYFNTPPTVVLPGSTLTLDEDTFVDFTVAATDPDASDSVVLNFISLPSQGVMAYFDFDAGEFVPISTSTSLPNSTSVRYWPNLDVVGTDTFALQARDIRNSNPLDLSIVKPITTLTIQPINDAPALASTQIAIVSNGYGFAALSSGVTITDDASQNDGIVTVTISSVGAEDIKLINVGGLQGYNGAVVATSRVLTGTVSQFNAAFAAGVEFYPADGVSTGTLSFSVNDNGNNDYRANQPGLTAGPLNIDVNVDSQDTLGFSAGFIGVTTLMSAGVFGAYKIMKKKKLIPEEADPWENDELFDMTLDNPLYSGSNPSSLEPVFDSK